MFISKIRTKITQNYKNRHCSRICRNQRPGKDRCQVIDPYQVEIKDQAVLKEEVDVRGQRTELYQRAGSPQSVKWSKIGKRS
jgi:hypothetical protein